VILAASLGTILWTRWLRPPDRALAIADALGLAMFAISGAQIAEALEHHGIVVVLMGALTGVAGGVLRDVLTGEIPLILRKGQIYATAAIAGLVLYVFLQGWIDRTTAALAGMACIAAIRIGAIAWNWTLPVFSIPGPEDP
jgi:uncharacterized membrane protein YeiH